MSAEKLRQAQSRLLDRTDSPATFAGLLSDFQSSFGATLQRQREVQIQTDWADLCRYAEDNQSLPSAPPPRAVFIGDSITEFWEIADPRFFADGYVDRGISGQTSPQLLVRFAADVLALRPAVVHVMVGTNDIAGNTGPAAIQDYENNILAMITLARSRGIAVVLAGIPPSKRLYWRGELDPRPVIGELNSWLQSVATQQRLVYVDYGAVLADAAGGMRPELTNDGVHPNRDAYALMRPLAEQAITAAAGRGASAADSRPTAASRAAMLERVAADVAAARRPAPASAQRPSAAQPPAPPPTPARTSTEWERAPNVPLWKVDPPGGRFAPVPTPAGWPAPFVTNVSMPQLHVFRPHHSNHQGILVLPGGAYLFVSVQNEGAEFAARLNELGYTAFVLTYRLPGEGWTRGADVPLQDAQRAMRLIRARAVDWDIDPATVATVGFSAGGHLAATLATGFDEPVYAPVDDIDALSARPFAAALIYPVITMSTPGTHAWTRELLLGPEPSAGEVARRSPQLLVSGATPPLFLVHAVDDAAVPVANSIDMLAAMRTAGRPVEAHILGEGGHAFASGYPGTATAHWIDLLDVWLRRLRAATSR